MIKLTIDDRAVEVSEGTTVLEAARANGISIPTLCNHSALEPYGGCRLCVVEVQGARLPQASCTLPAAEGMVVRTNTPALQAGRKFVLTMLFSERNHFCPFCQLSGGDCELQNAAYAQDMTYWEFQPNWNPFPVDASHPDFVLDNNRCILCRRCVRACTDLVGNATWGIEERGSASLLVADYGVPWGSSSCVACGTCAQVCPTGAIIDRYSAYQGHDRQVTHTHSICLGCSVGCGIDVITRDNRLVRIDGDWQAARNGGVLCHTGRIEPLKEERQRITAPLIRRNGALVATTWEEALTRVAIHLGTSPNVLGLASNRLPVEALTVFKQIFTNGLSKAIATSLEEGHPTALSAVAADALHTSFESPASSLHTADCFVTVGTNLAHNHEVIGFFVKRRVRDGAKLITIDAVQNKLSALAAVALQPTPGTEAETLNQLADLVQEYKQNSAPDQVEISLAKAAQVLANAKQPVIVYGKGVNSAPTFAALQTLAKVAGAGLLGVKGQANSLAAAQLGLDQPFQLNESDAVYVALGDDYAGPSLMKRLAPAHFVAVQASYTGPLTDRADVVLPVEMWAEQTGHFVSLDGFVQTAQAALVPPSSVHSNLAVLEELAQHLGLTLTHNWQAALAQRTPSVALVY